MNIEQLANELHRKANKPKPTRKVITDGIDSHWTCDLCDLKTWDKTGAFEGHNDGYRYYLLVLDCFSRYMWARPLKTATAAETWAAFKSILDESKRKPIHLWTDQGSHFKGSFAAGCKAADIDVYNVHTGVHKAAMAERGIRTLNALIWKQLTIKQNRRWIDVLQDCVKVYNNRKSVPIGMTPAQASKLSDKKEDELWTAQYGDVKPNIAPKYKVGQWVRISRVKGLFEKEQFNWSTEVFKIVEVYQGHPPMYALETYEAKPERLIGRFYEQELQPTEPPEDQLWLVSKVHKQRTVNGKKEVQVSWIGFPEHQKQWIPASDVVQKF